jgi:hypothetical protein
LVVATNSSPALASSDTGPTERLDVHDDRSAEQDALDGPTVTTSAVEDTAADAEESPRADSAPESEDGPDPEPEPAETEDVEHDPVSASTMPVAPVDDGAEPEAAAEQQPAGNDEEHDPVGASTMPVAPIDDCTEPEAAAEQQPAGNDEEHDPVGASTVPVASVRPPVEPARAGTAPAGTAPAAAADAPPAEDLGPADDDTTAIPTTARRRFHIPRSPWQRTLAALAVVVVLLAAIAAPSVIHALTRPGSDTVAARLAEWGRDHGMGPLVTWAEARQYDLDQPATGGAPAGGIPPANGAVADHPGGSPAPPPLPTPPGLPPLPGEGQWQTVVSTPHGDALRLATVRPDAQHTSFLVGVLWMDPTLVRGALHPGTEDPGGSWSVPTSVDTAEQRTVVDAFSAGFRLQGDSHGGWYLDGKEARPLVPGAASLVIHKNGTTDVGAWDTEVHISPDVAAVRQNLIPLVDHGTVNPTCATGGTAEWGSTVGQAAYINRSAFGVTASGAEIYVGGPALSVCSLGEILRSAGAVRGMELDINPAWVSGAYFHPNGRARPDAFQLFPGEQVGAQHYLQTSSRDFVSFDLRSVADATGAGVIAPSSQHNGVKHPSSSGQKHH